MLRWCWKAARFWAKGVLKIDILGAVGLATLLVWVGRAEREYQLAAAFISFFVLSHRVQSKALQTAAAKVERQFSSSRLELKHVDFAWRTFTCLATMPATFAGAVLLWPVAARRIALLHSFRDRSAGLVYWSSVAGLLVVECVMLCVRDHWGRKRVDYPIARHPLTTAFVWLSRYAFGLALALSMGAFVRRFTGVKPSTTIPADELVKLGVAHLVSVLALFGVLLLGVKIVRVVLPRGVFRRRAARESPGPERAGYVSSGAEFAPQAVYIVFVLAVSFATVCAWSNNPFEAWWQQGSVPNLDEIIQRALLAWHLSVAPIIVTTPVLVIARLDRRNADLVRSESRFFEGVHIDLARGWLLCQAVVLKNLPLFLISLPLSTVMSYEAPPAQRLGFFLTGTVTWLGPFLRDLYFVDDTLQWAYQFGLRRTIERLNHHVLILGFSDLGRRLVRTLLEVNVFPYRSLHDDLSRATNILLPTGRLAKVITSVAAVELDERSIAGVTRIPGFPPIGWVDLSGVVQELSRASARTDATGNSASDPADIDYIVPVVIGDGAGEEAQSTAQLERSAFVVSLIDEVRTAERSQTVLHRLEMLARQGVRIPAVIAIHSSTYVPYVTEKRLDESLPIHYIIPEHLEGLNAAVLTYAAFLAQQDLLRRNPRILVCGSGKRLFYLLDSFVKSFSASELKKLDRSQTTDDRPILTLLSLDERFSSMAASSLHEPAGPPDAGPVPFQKWRAADLLNLLDIEVIDFLRNVTRRPTPSDGVPNPVDGSVHIPLIRGDASDYGTIYAVLRNLQPDIIVVFDEKAEDELKAINALGTNIVRLRTENGASDAGRTNPPLLLVSGDTGKLHIANYFDRALRYYSSLFDPQSATRYPSPFLPQQRAFSSYGDPLIDALDDPAERLVGIIRAYLDPRHGVPVELNFCDPDSPGMMASHLARLAGYQTYELPTPNLSFANTRLIARPEDKFIVKGFAYLNGAAPSDGDASDRRSPAGPKDVLFCRLAIVAGREPSSDAEGWKPLKSGDDVGATIRGLWPGELPPITEPTFKSQQDSCCGMPTCPIEAFNKLAAGIVVEQPGRRKQGDEHPFVLLKRRFVIGDCHSFQRKAADDRPFAHFRLSCRNEHHPGAFAIALNALLCRRVEPVASPPAEVFNLTYISSYECHDERQGVFTCYGRRTIKSDVKGSSSPPANLTAADVIEHIEIFPIRDPREGRISWAGYTRNVAEFLNDHCGGQKTFEVASKEIGANGAQRFLVRRTDEGRQRLEPASEIARAWERG